MPQVLLNKPNGMTAWLKIYRTYMEAFPVAERKPFRTIVSMYRRGKTDVWCMERDGKFTGFASTVNGDGLILLDYLAVTKECRGKGIGSAAMKELQRLYGGQGLFVEIESTLEDAPNHAEREKRKRFYQMAGMKELGVWVKLFGVHMELLGSRCSLDFEDYRAFYRKYYSAWAAEHIEPEN